RTRQPGTIWFRYDRENNYQGDGLLVKIPKDALYNHLYFTYSQGPKPEGGYSLVQHVHNTYTPLFKSYELQIKPDQTLPVELQSKALIVDEKGQSHGGKFKDGYVHTQTRSFGSFHVRVDTIPPQVKPLNITNGKNL